jgi:hypothetical protein
LRAAEGDRAAAATWARGILLHELVHFLQQENGAFAERPGCDAWSPREQEAYRIQYEWLWAHRAFAALRRSRPEVPMRRACDQAPTGTPDD